MWVNLHVDGLDMESMMSLWVRVGSCPNALEVKAFQRVSKAADCKERMRRSCCCVSMGSGMCGGSCD